jgi:hypothetical protein
VTLVLLSWIAKAIAVVFGAWLGFLLSLLVGYYVGDRGDVGSALLTVIFMPIGILSCSIGAYFVASVALSYVQ